MSQRAIFRLLVIIALMVEMYALGSSIAWRNRARPMSSRTVEAFKANSEHPGAWTQAALEESIARDVRDNDRRLLFWLVPLLALNGVVVYFLWNYDTRERTA